MTRTRFIFVVSILILAASVSGFGQTPPAVTSKIVIVNTAAFFDEKAGITRIVAAAKQLNTELTPRRTEVQQFVARVEALTKELETLRANVGKGIPIDEKAAQAKVDELDRLKLEGKYKEDDYNAMAQKRQNEVVGPAYNDALKALGEYVKSKGFGIVFDASKDQNGILIFATEQFDITKDFIAIYNARPATAITSVPK